MTPADSKQKTLAFIESHYQEKGCPATITDIMTAVGFKSPRCVNRYYAELEKEGLIRRHRGHAIPTRFKITRLAKPEPRQRVKLARAAY